MSRPRSTGVRSEPMHLRVARHLRTQIEAGVLRDGEQLPSTRKLAQQWGTSAFTISKALNALVNEGLVVTRPRSGCIVHAPDQRERQRLRTDTPQVILIGGYAGSGKTELGRILARETGWPMLDKDTITRPVVEIALEQLGQSPHDRESETYLTLVRPREYEALIATMRENVECGISTILTAPFIREFADPAWLSRIQATCVDLGADLTLAWVYCDAESMHAYLRHRGAARDAAKLANWDSYLSSIDLDFRPPGPHVLIDNSTSAEPLQSQAQRLLSTVLQGGTQCGE